MNQRYERFIREVFLYKEALSCEKMDNRVVAWWGEVGLFYYMEGGTSTCVVHGEPVSVCVMWK